MEEPNKSLEVILKNIVNETYAKDISKKVSSSHQIRIKQGGFICGVAPYGYTARKDEDGIRRLYVDDNTAPIVREIFDLYLQGLSSLDLSKLLLERKVYIATEYRRFGKAISDTDEPMRIWKPTTILQVLKNRVYTGALIQGRNQKHLYEGKKRERLEEEYWTVTENAHEAIVSSEVFHRVQELLSSKSNPIQNSGEKNRKAKDDTMYRGKVYCGICKRKMTAHRQCSGKKTVFYFSCNRFTEFTTEKCKASITETTLEKTVKAAFDRLLSANGKNYKIYLDGYEKLKKEMEKTKETELTRIRRKISELAGLQSECYEKYVLGKYSKGDFEREKESLNRKKGDWEALKEKRTEELEEEIVRFEEKHKYLKALFQRKNRKWDKDFVDAVIDKIYIGRNHTVEIQFNFEEESVIAKKLGRKIKEGLM